MIKANIHGFANLAKTNDITTKNVCSFINSKWFSKPFNDILQFTQNNDAYFYYFGYKIYVSFVGAEFFDDFKNWYAHGCTHITFFLSREQVRTGMCYFSTQQTNLPGRNPMFYLPLNFKTTSVIYTGNSDQTQNWFSADGAPNKAQIYSVNKHIISYTADNEPYDAYSQPSIASFHDGSDRSKIVIDPPFYGNQIIIRFKPNTNLDETINYPLLLEIRTKNNPSRGYYNDIQTETAIIAKKANFYLFNLSKIIRTIDTEIEISFFYPPNYIINPIDYRSLDVKCNEIFSAIRPIIGNNNLDIIEDEMASIPNYGGMPVTKKQITDLQFVDEITDVLDPAKYFIYNSKKYQDVMLTQGRVHGFYKWQINWGGLDALISNFVAYWPKSGQLYTTASQMTSYGATLIDYEGYVDHLGTFVNDPSLISTAQEIYIIYHIEPSSEQYNEQRYAIGLSTDLSSYNLVARVDPSAYFNLTQTNTSTLNTVTKNATGVLFDIENHLAGAPLYTLDGDIIHTSGNFVGYKNILGSTFESDNTNPVTTYEDMQINEMNLQHAAEYDDNTFLRFAACDDNPFQFGYRFTKEYFLMHYEGTYLEKNENYGLVVKCTCRVLSLTGQGTNKFVLPQRERQYPWFRIILARNQIAANLYVDDYILSYGKALQITTDAPSTKYGDKVIFYELSAKHYFCPIYRTEEFGGMSYINILQGDIYDPNLSNILIQFLE